MPEPAPAEQPKPAIARAPRFSGRADGGFGPMGSGAVPGSTGRSGYGRGAAAQWTADDFKEERRESVEFSNGGGYRSGDRDSGAPQFLVEADDLFDDEGGEGRLVAPPVLGEAPSPYRDF